MTSTPVLIVGATGRLGSELVRQLRAHDWPIRAMTREPARAAHLAAIGADVVQGDLRDPGSLERAVEGCDRVVASAHAALGRGANSPQTVDRTGHRSLIDISRTKGVKRFVYVSAIGAGPDHPVDFFRIKYETEEYLKASGLSYSIVRGAAFMETLNHMVGEPYLKKGKVMLFGKGDRRTNHVSVRDVAYFVNLALEDERLENRHIEVGGPENMTQLEVGQMYGNVTGRPVKYRRLPVPMLQAALVAVGTFHPVVRRMMTMGLTLATKDTPHDMQETLREFPTQLTRFETVARDWYADRTSG